MNKPVAWQVAEMLFDIEESAIEMAKVYGDKIIPLYTHPVKEQELLNQIKALKEERKNLKKEVKALKEKIDNFSDYKDRT